MLQSELNPRGREPDLDKHDEPLLHRLSKFFLGEGGLYKYDSFLRRQLIKSGLSENQLKSTREFIRWVETNHTIVTLESDPRTSELKRVEQQYKVTTEDLLKIVKICERVGDINEFSKLVFSVVSIDEVEFSKILELLDNFANIPGADEVLRQLSSLEGIKKQSIYSLNFNEAGFGFYRSNNYRTIHESPELVSSFLEQEPTEVFSKTNKDRYATLLKIFREKSRDSKGSKFYFSPEDIPLIFDIVSDDDKYTIFYDYYSSVSEVVDYKVSIEIQMFLLMLEVIPEIIDLFKTGFNVTSHISKIIGDDKFRDLVSKGADKQEIIDSLPDLFPVLGLLKTILNDELFCSNAKVLSNLGMVIYPEYNTRFIDGQTIRDPIFYEVRPTEMVEKIGFFYRYGYKKFGLHYKSGKVFYSYMSTLDILYSELEQILESYSTEQIKNRLEKLPDDFYIKIYRSKNTSYDKKEALYLIRKVFSFDSDELFVRWLHDLTQDENLNAVFSQQWLKECSGLGEIDDFELSRMVLEYLFDADDINYAVQRLGKARQNVERIISVYQEISDLGITLFLEKVEHIVRLGEYSDEQRKHLLDILISSKVGSRALYDENFEVINVALNHPKEVLDKVEDLLKMTITEYSSLASLFFLSNYIDIEDIRFLFNNADVLIKGYLVIKSLDSDLDKNSFTSGISKFSFGPFIRNLYIFGTNPDLSTLLTDIIGELGYSLRLEDEGVAQSLLQLSKNPSAISVAKKLRDKVHYTSFTPHDYKALLILANNEDLLNIVIQLGENIGYEFRGEDIDVLKNYFSSSERKQRLSFISFFANTFLYYKLEKYHIKFFEQVTQYEAIKKMCLQLNSHGDYRFHPSDLPALNEIVQNKDMQLFVVELFKLGVQFNSYNLQSYKQLFNKKEDVISFLQQDKINSEILSYNMQYFKKFVPENLPAFLRMVVEIETSQSHDIRVLKDQLIEQLIYLPNPEVAWKQIEAIFIKNHLPLVGKVFKIFNILYPPNRVESILNDHLATSPQLRHSGKLRRRYMIYRDLLHCHVKSCNRSLRQYLETLQIGYEVCEKYEAEGFESLSEEEKYQLNEFLDKFQILYVNSNLDLIDKKTQVNFASEEGDVISDVSFLSRLNQLKEAIGVSSTSSLFTRLNEMYAKPLGKQSISELLVEMNVVRAEADRRGRSIYLESLKSGGRLDFDVGYYLKSVNEQYYHLIGQNGSVSKEFLGPSAGSDLTPFDTDLSIILEKDILLGNGRKQDFNTVLKSSLSAPGSYGELVLVIKDRGQFVRTNIEEMPGSLPKPGEVEHKLEIFKTGILGETHYGIRTGFPVTDVEFMIFGSDMSEENKNSVIMEVVKNGYYIPIVDEQGLVIFTPEQFDKLRTVFAGIKHISDEHVSIDMSETNTPIGDFNTMIDSLVEQMKESREVIEKQSEIIISLVQEVLKELDIDIFDPRTGSILGAYLDNTGSTARGTNSIGDADFDMHLFLDALDYKNRETLKNALISRLNPEIDNSYSIQEFTQIRLKGVRYPGLEGVDIDLGLLAKTDERGFTSHDAIVAKLNDIESELGPKVKDRVLANIIYAKDYLKSQQAYGSEVGGLVGIALENLIIQNNGNVITAFRRFIEAANSVKMSFEDFKREFPIWNAGKGARGQKHENYTSEMTAEGFKKTYLAMIRFLESLGIQL